MTLPRVGQWVKFPSGARMRVSAKLFHDGHLYVQPSGRHGPRPKGKAAGDAICRGGAVITGKLGHRVVSEGRISYHCYYLARLGCGHERPVSAANMSPSSNRTGENCILCRTKERLCQWCGEDRPEKFNRTVTSCMSCDRVRHRRGRWPCGKPRRVVVLIEVKNEHNCDKCEPWRRSRASKPASERECPWCGNCTKRGTLECSSCRGAAGNNGRLACGKPVRRKPKWSPPAAEHQCEKCCSWPVGAAPKPAKPPRRKRRAGIRACQWCGHLTDAGWTCPSCRGAASNNGRHPCGKPKRVGPRKVAPIREHTCHDCGAWPTRFPKRARV